MRSETLTSGSIAVASWRARSVFPRAAGARARWGASRVAIAALVVALGGCSSEPSGAGGAAERDIIERDVSGLDVADDVTNDTGTANDADGEVRADAFVDDAFTRPDILPDVPSADASTDTTPDAADVSSDVADVADATPDASDTVDTAPDVPAPDVVLNAAIDATGTIGCLEWEILADYDVFDFKGSDFLVRYSVTNRCSESFLYVVEHMNDMFPLAIHKDGELWTYLGLCPGRGPRFEWTFRTIGEGISRGFVWRVAEHESLLTDCGVEFDAEATYELVGYGSTEVDTFSPTSTPYPLTPAFPITIRE